MEAVERSVNGDQQKADHLCVLVHGLWGNPKHLAQVASALREKHAESKLYILLPKSNSDNFTYDGIELGGERVTKEIEDTVEKLEQDGHTIKKFSIVGYSLGGLVARYVVGLLFSKGWFDKIKPMNFTTFATPHLGVRTPLVGIHSRVWNVLGARTLSVSGRQLFIIDAFRETGRPLLAVLADPDSIFIRGLAMFKNRCLYANIINDRSAPYYTTAITRIDPFDQIDSLRIEYLKGYEPNILDPSQPVSILKPETAPAFYTRWLHDGRTILGRIPIFALLVVLLPIGSAVFLVNSGIQSIRSRQRIKLHESGKAGIGIGGYRIPLMVRDVRSAVEEVFEGMNNRQTQEYLPAGSEPPSPSHERRRSSVHFPPSSQPQPPFNDANSTEKPSADLESASPPSSASSNDVLTKTRTNTQSEFPTLALSDDQFEMIDNLDDVGFRKYEVHIQNVRHSHAAIIVRTDSARYAEGKVVIRHWLEEEFQI
ncbi:MAG: hypothetical protein M1827_004084 [Pycnora praestabilis]|nr:MAG: hypothetical protein M1827_004084 [Pycnora praestabilis]